MLLNPPASVMHSQEQTYILFDHARFAQEESFNKTYQRKGRHLVQIQHHPTPQRRCRLCPTTNSTMNSPMCESAPYDCNHAEAFKNTHRCTRILVDFLHPLWLTKITSSRELAYRNGRGSSRIVHENMSSSSGAKFL